MYASTASVGVPLWGAALFFGAVVVVALAFHALRWWRSARRRRAGLVDSEAGWFRAAAYAAGGAPRYVCAAVREGGAIVEVWVAGGPDEPLPPPKDARPFAVGAPEKPIGEAIALGLRRHDAEDLVQRVLSSAGGT